MKPINEGRGDGEAQPLINNDYRYSSLRNRSRYNIIVLGISFCVLFSAFSPTQNLQTTINKNIGSDSLAVLYAFLSVTNFISPFVILNLGERLSLIVGTLTYSAYIAANIKVLVPTLYASSVLLGIGGAVLWTAQGSFVIRCSTESTIGANTGLFFALFQVNQIIGNLGAAALIDKAGLGNEVLFLIFLGVSLSSLIGFSALGKPIKMNDKGQIIEKENQTMSIKDRLLSTVVLFKDRPIQLLIVPLLYSGISQSFFFGIFPNLLGKEWLGYVLAVFGFCDAAGSMVMGKLSDIFGRKILVVLSTLFCVSGTVLCYLLNRLVVKSQQQMPYYFIVAALLGLADAGFNTQLYALIGVIYPKKGEAAAGVFKFVQSTATAAAFVYGPYASLFDNAVIVSSLVVLSSVLFMFADNFSKRVSIDELTDRELQTPLLNDQQVENVTSKLKTLQNNKINIIILGLCFCILFSAFSPTQILQTTINQNLGYYTLAVLYSSLSISNFISPFIVSKLGEKPSLIIGTLSYALYIGSNIYVTQPSLYISSILVGFGGAILWNAQGSLVIKYSTEETIGANTGLFFSLFQTDQIIGNLGSATLINKARFSNKILFIIFMGISLIPIIGFLFLNNPNKIKTIKSINIQDEEETRGNEEENEKKKDIDGDDDNLSIKNIIKSTIILFKDKPIQLLIPSLLYSGISQTFFFGVFPSLIGVEWVGYVMSVFGLFDALSSLVLGKLSDKFGRKVLILISTISCIFGTVLICLAGQSKVIPITGNNSISNDEYKILCYFIGSASLGFSDAGFNTQLYSLLGALYPTNGEAAVGVFKFVQSTATAIAFIYGPYTSLFENVVVLDSLIVISCVFFVFADKFPKKVPNIGTTF
ncbi:hypothetical protein ACTA71_007892 [Dictyostelium dimigraforme]